VTEQKDYSPSPFSQTDPLAEFQPYLDDIHILDDQKHAFLELLWSIMVQFAALGFGVDAASQAIAAQLSKTDCDTPASLRQHFKSAKTGHNTIQNSEVMSI